MCLSLQDSILLRQFLGHFLFSPNGGGSGVRGCLAYTACLVCVFAVKSSYLGTSPYCHDHGCKAASWLVGLRISQVNMFYPAK